jgi:hypothetical protein
MGHYNRADRENKPVLRWKVGRLDGWKTGRLEDWMAGRLEAWKISGLIIG